jgi:uncharacterized repeat protein (TIGR02543 family)
MFGGWYTETNGAGTQFTADTTVTGDIRVYAKWTSAVPGSTLQAALAWLDTNAEDGGEYAITVSAAETIAPKTLSYSGKRISITLDGGTAERTVSLSDTGSLFTLESGVTLTLDNNITLQGGDDNTASLVRINGGGTLVMNTGSKISGNRIIPSASASFGGGVYIDSNATFTMNDGTISGNTTPSPYSAGSYGGGVYVSSGGTFTKLFGTIYGLNADSAALKNTAAEGPAVYASSDKIRTLTAGTGIMLDSKVSGSEGGWDVPGSNAAPDTPSNLRVLYTTGSSIRITWDASPNATGYRLYRSTSSSGPFSQVYSGAMTEYTNTNLSKGTSYYFRVTAYNSVGESQPSRVLSWETFNF